MTALLRLVLPGAPFPQSPLLWTGLQKPVFPPLFSHPPWEGDQCHRMGWLWALLCEAAKHQCAVFSTVIQENALKRLWFINIFLILMRYWNRKPSKLLGKVRIQPIKHGASTACSFPYKLGTTSILQNQVLKDLVAPVRSRNSAPRPSRTLLHKDKDWLTWK